MGINTSFIAHSRASDKAEQSVKEHLQEVHDLASFASIKINLANAGALIGLLHDFGKYSNAFQVYIKSAIGQIDSDSDDFVNPISHKGRVDHSTAGAIWLKKILLSAVKTKVTGADIRYAKIAIDMLAICIASHHSGLIDCLPTDGGYKGLNQRLKKTDDETHLPVCIEQGDQSIKNRALELVQSDLVVEMIQLLKQIEQTELNERSLSECERYFYQGMVTKFLFSCLIDADRISSADFEIPENKKLRSSAVPNWQSACEKIENFVEGLSQTSDINRLRHHISNTCKQRAKDKRGIYSLTVPTGGGKTFASLRYGLHHANTHQLDRIIYVIPYTSIIDQNAKAIRQALNLCESDPWVLECHSNLEPEQQTWRSKLVSENWDAPIVLVTMVQLLETLFAGGTRSVRKLHQLANSVVIFDEIQTLPINCVHLFCNAINFMSAHAGMTALMCTATQPLLGKLDKPEFGQLQFSPNHELMDDTSKLFADLKRTEVIDKMSDSGWSAQELAQFAMEQVERKGSCLVIVNTKAWARALFDAVNEDTNINQIRVIHLSTAQCPAHRKVLLGEVVERLKQGLPTLCLSTQLIEAGVDVDFAAVIRFNAGLDSIAQAAGRCNRNGKNNLGQVFVVNPDKEPTAKLIDIEQGKSLSLIHI